MNPTTEMIEAARKAYVTELPETALYPSEFAMRAALTAAIALIPGEPVAWQWRQTYAGRWGNWNNCGLSATDVQKWLDLAQELPDEVQVRPLYAAPAPLPVAVKALADLVACFDEFEASTGNMEEAYYKLAKYAYPQWMAARAALTSVAAETGKEEPEQKLGRFGWHPDPVIDFEVEIEKLESRWFDAAHGIAKPGELPETMKQVAESIDRAMSFRVGGREDGVIAKNRLRKLDAIARSALSSPVGGAEEEPKSPVEPYGYAFQHEETGLTQVVDVQQVEWGFEKNNPRWQKVGAVYLHAPISSGELEDYDAGLLNDFGGGNVEWWQDYLRAEIGRANDFWREQVDSLQSSPTSSSDIAALREENENFRRSLAMIANTPAWGAPDKWETTPAEVRQLARNAIAKTGSQS